MLLFAFNVGVYAQGASTNQENKSPKQKKADKLFEAQIYHDAIEQYEKLKSKDYSPPSLIRNLAICYYKVLRTDDAIELFELLVNSRDALPEDYFYYAQVLKQKQQYDEAEIWLEKYRKIATDASGVALKSQGESIIKEIYKKVNFEIEPVYFNSEFSDFGTVFWQNKLVFTSSRKSHSIIQHENIKTGQPYLSMYIVEVERPAFFEEARLLSRNLNTRYHDGPACFNDDGTEMFFTRNSSQTGKIAQEKEKQTNLLLYSAQLQGNSWSNIEEMPFNSNAYSCAHPSISTDGNTLYFASNMPGGYGGSDIYFSKRFQGYWQEPVNLGPKVNTSGEEMFPFINTNGDLYFSSNGHLGLGGMDVFKVEAFKINGENEVSNVGYPLNSSYDDFSIYFMKNSYTGYFASNRPGGMGDDDIYKFTMLNNVSSKIKLQGVTKNSETKQPVPQVQVHVQSAKGETVFSGLSGDNGEFEAEIASRIYYYVNVTKENYRDSIYSIIADESVIENGVFQSDLLLKIDAEWGFFGLVYDIKTGIGLADVYLVVRTKDNKQEITTRTDAKGSFSINLQPETEYSVLFVHEDYLPQKGNISTVGKGPGWMNANMLLDIGMKKIGGQ